MIPERLIKIAGSIAVALLVFPAVSGQDSQTGSIRVGFISEPTAHHRTSYLDILARLDGVDTVAVVDPTGETLSDAKRRLGVRFYESGFRDEQQMLSRVDPELTIVTTEGHHAPAAVIAALKSGSHVVTEKPGCTRLDDFERMAAAAKAHDRHLMLAMATRSSPAIRRARQLVQDGVLGRPYSVSLLWQADQTRLKNAAWQNSWVSDPQRAGGGKLIYHGIHFLDAVQHLLDEPIKKINGFTQNVGGQPIKVEDSAVMNFLFASGATGTLNTGYYLPSGKQTEIRIWGSHGWLRLELHEQRPLQWQSTKSGQPSEVQSFDYAGEPGLYSLFFADVLQAIREDSQPPISTAESLQAMRVVFAGYRAASSGKTQAVFSPQHGRTKSSRTE